MPWKRTSPVGERLLKFQWLHGKFSSKNNHFNHVPHHPQNRLLQNNTESVLISRTDVGKVLNSPDSTSFAVTFYFSEIPQSYRLVVKVRFSHTASECNHTHSISLLQRETFVRNKNVIKAIMCLWDFLPAVICNWSMNQPYSDVLGFAHYHFLTIYSQSNCQNGSAKGQKPNNFINGYLLFLISHFITISKSILPSLWPYVTSWISLQF